MTSRRFYHLIAPLAYSGDGDGLFTYHSEQKLTVGQLVHIPIGRRQSLGVVTNEVAKPTFATKAISLTIDQAPLPGYLVALAAWMAEYYAASPASVWTTLLPAGIERQRRATQTAERMSFKSQTKLPLNADQAAVVTAIRDSPLTTQLLHGITGSGKTRIYLELAADTLSAGRSVLVLVPEITLAPQLVAHFEAAFGGIVIATHSRMTESQRHQAWAKAMAADGPRIIIGPRSSLFLPVTNLGLIVVDECHETTYKQEQNPRYFAPAVAGKLAQLTKSKLILGSATPGLTELYLAGSGRLGYHRLTKRATSQPLPATTIIDLRDKSLLLGSRTLTAPLLDALAVTLAQGRQSLLYLNRRGSAASLLCGTCGHVILCANCELPLTFHADYARLICHHCNYRLTPPAVCPACSAADLRFVGSGTKGVEAEVAKLFPEARLARLDRDSSTLAYLNEVHKGLHDGKIDILIGTQMIAKGLDLPELDTVGIVSADTLLHLPDFRAAERTFDLLTQVSGRAGRGDRPGHVFIQTYTPAHPAIVAASRHDYDAFAASELQQRQKLTYPPYTYLLKLIGSARSPEAAQANCQALASQLQKTRGLAVLGPAPAFREKIGKNYRWQLLIKSPERHRLVAIAQQLPRKDWSADLDPSDTL